jgi:hypothetical protein
MRSLIICITLMVSACVGGRGIASALDRVQAEHLARVEQVISRR